MNETEHLTIEDLEAKYYLITRSRFLIIVGSAIDTAIALLVAMYGISHASIKKALEDSEVKSKVAAIEKAKANAPGAWGSISRPIFPQLGWLGQ